MYSNLLPIFLEDNWYVNLKNKDIDILVPNTFWKYVFKAWCQYSTVYPMTEQEVMSQFLWYNSYTRIDNKPVYIRKLYQTVCKFIRDLWNGEKNSFYTYQEINDKYPNMVMWLDYISLIKAIPNRWTSILEQKVNTGHNFQHKYELISEQPVSVSKTKLIYNHLIDNPLATVDAFNNWEKVIPNFTSLEEYCKCYNDLYRISNSTKLRDFQYRLLHKKLPSNKELHRWNIKSSPQCEFCRETDSINHLLYECEYIRKVWNEWEKYINDNYGVGIEVDMTTVVTNRFISNSKNIINGLGLILKQLIYRCKCQKVKITFAMFLSEIQVIRNIELQNARKQGKVEMHYRKWEEKNDVSQNFEDYIADYIRQM